MPLPMSVESESKETTVASSEALTRWYNLPEEVLVLHQTLKVSAFIFLLSLLQHFTKHLYFECFDHMNTFFKDVSSKKRVEKSNG